MYKNQRPEIGQTFGLLDLCSVKASSALTWVWSQKIYSIDIWPLDYNNSPLVGLPTSFTYITFICQIPSKAGVVLVQAGSVKQNAFVQQIWTNSPLNPST